MVDYTQLPSELSVEVHGAVRVVTLNRPGDRNAVNGPMHDALAEVWLLLEKDLDARSVLLTGAGDIFSAGGDYAWFEELQADRRAMELSVRTGGQILERMIRCELPIVAAVKGGAVGLGASLCVLSDLVVISEDGFYRDPHVALGLVAGDGGVAWTMSTSLQVAKEYLLLGDRLSAQDAYRLGMVNRVLPGASVYDEGLELALRLSRLPAHAAQATKRALNLQLQRSILGVADFALAAELAGMVGRPFGPGGGEGDGV
jgi:enoyl-CoA hydratase/carnithine racemase